MKILVFGASGGTGLCIVRQALSRGYAVTAFTRNPPSIKINHPNLRIIAGNVLDRRAIDAAVKGQDAVLCAIGAPSHGYTALLSEGTKNIVEVMERRNVRRFVCLSAVGVLGHDADFFLKHIMIPLFHKHIFSDRRVQLEEIMRSHLDWIVVRSVNLTDGPKSKYHATLVRPIGARVSRANVADFMLKQLTSDTFLREIPIVSG